MFEEKIVKLKKDQFVEAESIAYLIEDDEKRKIAFANTCALFAFKNYAEKNKYKHDPITNINLFRVPAVYERYEISDIYIGSERLDVRVSFDRNVFPIPKTHIKNSLAASFYVVFAGTKNPLKCECLGYIRKEDLVFDSQDDNYYYISTNILNPIENLKDEVNGFFEEEKNFYETEHKIAKENFGAFLDKELDDVKSLDLIEHLLNCENCRGMFVEYSFLEDVLSAVKHYPDLKEQIESTFQKPEISEINDDSVAEVISDTNLDLPGDDIKIEDINPVIGDEISFDINNDAEVIDFSTSQIIANTEEFNNEIVNTISDSEESQINISDNLSLEEVSIDVNNNNNNDVLILDENQNNISNVPVEPLVYDEQKVEEEKTVIEVENLDLTQAENPENNGVEISDDSYVDINNQDEEVLISENNNENIYEVNYSSNWNELFSENSGLKQENPEIEQKGQTESLEQVPYYMDDINNVDMNDSDIESVYNPENVMADKTEEEILNKIETNVEEIKKPMGVTIAISLAVVVAIAAAGFFIIQKPLAKLSNRPDVQSENYSETVENSESENMDQAIANAFSDGESAFSISSVSWQKPESLELTTEIKEYLSALGTSIWDDLDIEIQTVQEFIPTGPAKILLKINTKGEVDSVKVKESCGVPEIDNVIVKVVKNDTAKFKPSAYSILNQNINLILLVNF